MSYEVWFSRPSARDILAALKDVPGLTVEVEERELFRHKDGPGDEKGTPIMGFHAKIRRKDRKTPVVIEEFHAGTDNGGDEPYGDGHYEVIGLRRLDPVTGEVLASVVSHSVTHPASDKPNPSA